MIIVVSDSQMIRTDESGFGGMYVITYNHINDGDPFANVTTKEEFMTVVCKLKKTGYVGGSGSDESFYNIMLNDDWSYKRIFVGDMEVNNIATFPIFQILLHR